jgi:SAM-dependent methyltransferase
MRGISAKLRDSCPRYLCTNYFPGETLGGMVGGLRNENIECQTFADASFDVVISLDVMEHVNMPDTAFREVARTLVPGGLYAFSAPTYSRLTESKRRARYLESGDVEFLEMPPEYHGNPISNDGSLVTFHFGYDLVENINKWSQLDVTCLRFWDEHIGIIGNFTEIYICRKKDA